MTAPAGPAATGGGSAASSPNSGVRSVHTPNTGGQKRAMSYGPQRGGPAHAAKTVKPSSTRKGKR